LPDKRDRTGAPDAQQETPPAAVAVPPEIGDDEVAALTQTTLHSTARLISRQTLTQSGNAVFRVQLADGRNVAVRMNRRDGAFGFTRHNLDVLRTLGLPVPQVLASGAVPQGGGFIILEWVPGHDLQHELAQMSEAQMTLLAQTVTDYQRRVASLPQSNGFGWAPIGRHATSARWTDLFGAPSNEVPADDAPALDHIRARLRAVRRAVEPYFAALQPTCFLDDLTIKNVLVEHGVLCGIIDLDFVCYGDPLMAIGTTLAHIAADVGHAGKFYGEELIRCAAPSPDALRAIHFYNALWTTGFLSAAEAAGHVARAKELLPLADSALRLAEAS
jgi:Ser/Thr protein kinase RdoA (MazF antagonist)